MALLGYSFEYPKINLEVRKIILTFVSAKTKRNMRHEKEIGKKVWLLDGSLGMGFRLKSKKTFTVVEWKSGKEIHDWANHFVIKDDENGNAIEVKEYQVVFALEDGNIHDYLGSNDVCAEVSTNSIGVVAVGIEWGDWKHEHLWCKDLMEYIGYKEIGSEVTEEDGSDCYSATHYYLKVA